MPTWKNYLIPHSLQEAIILLDQSSKDVRIIAGGTDLLLDIQQGRVPEVETLVDVNEIPDLLKLELHEEFLYIGASVPLKQISDSLLVKYHAEALSEAAGLVGGPQVRNSATLGGNVAHALPAADGTIALLALDAEVEIANSDGRNRKALVDLFRGPGQSKLDPQSDILVGFYVPVRQPGQASAFARVMRPQGVALPILNMAIWMDTSENQISDIRIAIGPAGPIPQRSVPAERVFIGKAPNENLKKQAIDVLLAETHFRTSPHRATVDYRKHLCGVLLEQAFDNAWTRATAQHINVI
ncbi:MAG: FAD binding domain-containing protein [Anaerolineaceae bacterium]|nr:FAD binding domain-containing protein [Anaerolineaceae bacterium]